MKKIILAGAVALFGLTNAQIAKGTTYITGSVGYSNTTNNETDVKQQSFNIMPKVGHFVAPNLAIGLGAGYEGTKSEYTNTLGNVETNRGAIVVEPFVRKYWGLGEKLYFFGELAAPMNFGKTETKVAGEETSELKRNSFGVAVRPGIDYFLNKNWTIEASIGEFGYNTSKADVDGAKSTDNYKFGFDLSAVQIGVKYVFGK